MKDFLMLGYELQQMKAESKRAKGRILEEIL
ncbi:hypothetical protein Deia_01122 [Candidatus Deianiraea vastatrix]|uniref:Uncharacterized protein n=1 Tax=Candidatus Deianiraea vastatrix TaxID=2163644 RepID=A0A5B8XF49_9RICK|nr:hypothetical protein Deia_01122 [Candidatus Deianiraea vastatrix]